MSFPFSRKTFVVTLLALVAATLQGETAARASRLPAATAPKAGWVQGWVANAAGAPLPGSVVHIYGTTMAGQNTRFEVTVGDNGRYRQRVPDGIYGVRAEYSVERDGKTYAVTLQPLDGITAKSHDAEEG